MGKSNTLPVAEIDRHRLYTKGEVAKLLRVSYRAINSLIDSGSLAHRIIGKKPRIPGVAIERFLMLDVPEPAPEPLPVMSDIETRAQRQRRAQDALNQIPGCGNHKGAAS